MLHYVYFIHDPMTGDLLYVGRSINPQQRLKDFIKRTGVAGVLIGPTQKYTDLTRAQAAELRAILTLSPPHNQRVVSGKGRLGTTQSPETRAKMSAARTGRSFSPDWLRNMSLAQQGKKATPETRLKMSLSKKGKPKSQEHRDKISASVKAARARISSTTNPA